MTWRDRMDEIETVSFPAVEYLRERAEADDTVPESFMPPKPRDDAYWFHASDAGCSCLWWPGNRASTLRISHTYVVPEARGEGYGKALTVYSHIFAEKLEGCDRIDVIAAHDEELYQELGMRIVEVRGDGMCYLEQVFDDED